MKLPEKEIAKAFVNEIEPDIFRRNLFPPCETLLETMHEASTAITHLTRFLEMSDRTKQSETKKEKLQIRGNACLAVKEECLQQKQ